MDSQFQMPTTLTCPPLIQPCACLQELAVDCLFHMPSLANSTLKAAALLCLHSSSGGYPISTALRLLDVAAQRAAAAVDPSAVLGLLLCALSGTSKAGIEQQEQQQQEQWQWHEAVVAAACPASLSLGSPAAGVAAALVPPLLRLCGQDDGSTCDRPSSAPRPLYGLLRLTIHLADAAAAAGAEGATEAAEAAGANAVASGMAQEPVLLEHSWLPAELLDQLPGLLLQFAVTCTAASEGSGVPSNQDATALGVQLVVALPALLRGLLDVVASTLQQQQQAKASGSTGGSSSGGREVASRLFMAALLPLLLELAQAEALRPAVLEAEQQLRAVLEACAAQLRWAGSSGGGTGADHQAQLMQLRAVCAAACGWEVQ